MFLVLTPMADSGESRLRRGNHWNERPSMITQDVLDGKKVIMVYLKGIFCPATDADATFVKEIYEDGRVVFSSSQQLKSGPSCRVCKAKADQVNNLQTMGNFRLHAD